MAPIPAVLTACSHYSSQVGLEIFKSDHSTHPSKPFSCSYFTQNKRCVKSLRAEIPHDVDPHTFLTSSPPTLSSPNSLHSSHTRHLLFLRDSRSDSESFVWQVPRRGKISLTCLLGQLPYLLFLTFLMRPTMVIGLMLPLPSLLTKAFLKALTLH